MLKVVKENYFSTVKHQFLLCFLKKNASHRTNDLENLKLEADSCRTETVHFPPLKRNNLEKKKETQMRRHILNSLSPIIP